MELRQLRYFQAVVEAGSITAAAAQLHMSQPPLSVAISKLESLVGVPLLVRTARGVEPTSAGRYLLDASTRILGQVDDVVADLRRFGAGVAGTLTLAAVPALTWHRVPSLLRRFARQAPEVEVRLVDPPPWAAMEMLQARSVDLAAILVADGERFRKRHSGDMEVHDAGPVPLVGVFPPEEAGLGGDESAPQAGKGAQKVPLSVFEGRTVLVPRRTAAVASLPEAVDKTFRRHGVTPGAVRTMETIQNGLALIEAGQGVGLMPDPDGASLRRFAVQTRSLSPEPAPMRALILARNGASKDPTIRGFLRLATQDPTRDRV